MKEQMSATALKAYLQSNNIRPSALAKKCHIDQSYLSRILNAKCQNPSFSVVVRLATVLNLPVYLIQELLNASYESFIIASNPEKASQHQFRNYLQLDAVDQSDFSMVETLTLREESEKSGNGEG